LFEKRAEEPPLLGVGQAIGVESYWDEVVPDKRDNSGIVEGARTEPGGVASTALER
jgi:hypothetical protein